MSPAQRTQWWPVALVAVVGFGLGFLLQTALSAGGSPPLVPPYSLPATLITVSGILLGFAIALRRAITGTSKKRVNPFVAVRIVAAAKASILAGALFAGFGAGIVVFFTLRTVAPQPENWWPVLATLGAGIGQTVIGVVAENLCRVPPPSDAESDGERDADEAPDSHPSLAASAHERLTR